MSYVIPKVFISSITFNSGQTLDFRKDDIVIFVGANNVGKSQALDQILQKARNPKARPQRNTYSVDNYKTNYFPHQLIEKVEVTNEGSIDDFRQWTQERFSLLPKQGGNTNSPPQYQYGDITINGEQYHGSRWEELIPDQHGNLPYIDIFWKSLKVMERLNIPNTSMQLGYQPSRNLIQRMYESTQEEINISNLFKETFDMDIVLNRLSGTNYIPIHVGERPEPNPSEQYLSPDFARHFRDLPLLEDQGNGMRAFFSLIYSTVGLVDKSAFFIDEPEVFLHPPHARKLGRFLTEKTADRTQLFVATHNGPFIRGVLDTDSSRIRIIRIDRDGDINPVHQLANTHIKNLWSDTVLRYSNALDGLFYKRVIVCESDSDCKFFAALSSAIGNLKADETMFVSSGGKNRVAVVVKALKAIGVEVKAVLDFDVLNDKSVMKNIMIALGGEWSETIAKDFNSIKQSVESKRPELNKANLLQQIENIFGEIESETLPRQSAKKIQGILRRSSPWSASKEVGESIIPSGNASQAWLRLHKHCQETGFHVIETGELESFVKDIGGHSQAWVNEVLKLDLATDQRLSKAREFVSRLFEQ